MVKKTIKKITSKSDSVVPEPDKVKTEAEKVDLEQQPQRKRGCAYCLNKQLPSYTDLATLKRFLSERSKILPKSYSHLCAKHQRGVTKNIKYARHLSLLHFTPKV